MNAYEDLKKLFEPDEYLEAIVFGPWGWGSAPPSIIIKSGRWVMARLILRSFHSNYEGKS